jgi:hypothetical protein
VGYSIHDPISMQTCDYAGTTCYEAKSVPAIYAIDQSSGYTTGGQVIKVDGFGFASGTIRATTEGGVACEVILQTAEFFTCRVGESSEATVFTETVEVELEDGEEAEEGADPETEEVPVRFVGQ